MATLLVKRISTGQLTTIHSNDRQDLVRQGKWYLSLKENGAKKYKVVISKA